MGGGGNLSRERELWALEPEGLRSPLDLALCGLLGKMHRQRPLPCLAPMSKGRKG